jgi:hypothetical protein
MKRILLAMSGILLSSTAEAAIHTPPVPISSSSEAVCTVVNTSSYLRTGKVILYDADGNMLNWMEYSLYSTRTAQVAYQVMPGAGQPVRCSVEGNTSAGEAGIRAALCAGESSLAPLAVLNLTSICLDAK